MVNNTEPTDNSEAHIIKKADLIREIIREEGKQARKYFLAQRKYNGTDMLLRNAEARKNASKANLAFLAFHKEMFSELLGMLERQADDGSEDCQQIISDFYDWLLG